MDGTLLNANMQISEENIQAIKYAQSPRSRIHGGHWAQPGKEALPPLQEAGIDCAMITLNGAHFCVRCLTNQELLYSPFLFLKKKPVH